MRKKLNKMHKIKWVIYLKNIFRNIGILALACFSFLVTDETIMVVKESDELMVEIKEKADNYFVPGVDGKIDDKYIKLGYDGLEIDVFKSYDQMKKIGYFNESMLVYKNIKHNNSLKNNIDKIVKANSKNEVALLFKNPNDIVRIINILKNNDLDANFLISKDYYLNNFEVIEEAIKLGNNIVIFDESKFFKKELKNHDYFCYSTLDKKCPKKILIEETYNIKDYNMLKEKIEKGSILLLSETNYLDIYIKYILGKGIDIVSLIKFTSER